MTFQQFMKEVAYLPATAFSGLVNILFGYTKSGEKHPEVSRGLLGLILDAIKFTARFIADFIGNHKKAIAVAFWASLLIGGATALTVFLWPAALTAIATFSIFDISIASIVGANALLQIGAIGTLAFSATSLLTYTIATIANTIDAIRNYVNHSAKNQPEEYIDGEDCSSEENQDIGSGVSLYEKANEDVPPYQGSCTRLFTPPHPKEVSPDSPVYSI